MLIQQGDVDTIKDVLSKSSKEQKDTLLNGKFVNTKHDRCEIKIRNNSDNCIFEVTAPFHTGFNILCSKRSDFGEYPSAFNPFGA